MKGGAQMRTLLHLLLALGLAACAASDPATDVVADLPPDAPPYNPACAPCPSLVGTALRVTSLYVTSPDSPDTEADEAIRDFLNEMWARDMALGLINMLLVIREYDPVTGVYVADGGSAWLHADGKYHFICGYSWPVVSTLDAATCTTDSTTNPSTVAFHAGPADDPNTCAPDGEPPNSITMTHVITHGDLKVDCAARTASYTGATLAGYIHEDTAMGLCACMSFDDATGAYTCDRTPDPESPLNYCFQRCGKGFALIGTVFSKVAKVPVITGPDGVPSFPLGGTFSAETIPNYADNCCRGENDCD